MTEQKRERVLRLRREMTPEEALFWERLRGSQLDGLHFRRQQPVAGFVVDFYCHAAGQVVEVDGETHRDQGEYDEDRDAILAAHGLRVLRVTNTEVREELAVVLERIRSACRVR